MSCNLTDVTSRHGRQSRGTGRHIPFMIFDKVDRILNAPLTNWSKLIFYVLLTVFKHFNNQNYLFFARFARIYYQVIHNI